MNHACDQIAVDAMGGDFAPQAIVEGVVNAAKQGVNISLFGTNLEKILTTIDANWQSLPISITETSESIMMSDEPVRSVRKKKDSSLVKAMESVADGESQAFFTAGNTGAALVAAIILLGKQINVFRPALASFIPTFVQGKKVLCLDLGANVDCKVSHLVQFAALGQDYWTLQSRSTNPKIGLLSNGQEPGKGNMAIKEAHTILQTQDLNFYGNIEPLDILNAHVDIVVCDGLVGNIFIKTIEAMAKTSQASTLPPQIATLLGVNGTVFVGHGASSASAITTGLIDAHEAIGKK